MAWNPLAAGKAYLLRNGGAGRLVLYQVTIAPAAEATLVALS